VLLDGLAQGRMTAPEWRRQVALLPAESVWWYDTVGDHFAATEAAGWASMGFDAQVRTWPVARLSSGERQRLALLRLLENRPRILLLDEPTANLDDGNTALVEALVRSYRERTGAGVLWVAHHTAQLQRVADRTVAMAKGHLISSGGAP
jgi:energy-coupling factor transporter ATP-binding protein EcfA2